jgi:hypothetical protein
MANNHTVAASAVTVPTTTETVLATLGPFNENMAGEFAQGVACDGNINLTAGTGATAVTMRIRRGGLTGTLIGVASVQTVTAGNVVNIPIAELDPTLVQVGVTYVVTLQQTAASANGTVNRVVFSCQDATAYE